MAKQISYKPENDLCEKWIENEVARLNAKQDRRKKYTKQEILDRLLAAAMKGVKYK